MFHDLVQWLVGTIGAWGYPGIIVLMALESSFFPFPSEVVIPPAAYLASRGEMNIGMVILCGIGGSLIGALFNYWLAMVFGRPFFERYGKYLFISAEAMEKADRFFIRHGHISTFIGRLLPGIRQYISLPAGIARMNIMVFALATALGAGIWVMVLAGLGWWCGKNEALIAQNLHWIVIVTVLFCTLLGFLYWRRWQVRKRAGLVK
jgi:membrane protein DedA with SNARE-associated domain